METISRVPFPAEEYTLSELPYPLNELAKAYLGARALRASRPNDATLIPNEAQQRIEAWLVRRGVIPPSAEMLHEWRQENTTDTTPTAENPSTRKRERPRITLFTTALRTARYRLRRHSDPPKSHASSFRGAAWKKKFINVFTRPFVLSQDLLDSSQECTATPLDQNTGDDLIRESPEENLLSILTNDTGTDSLADDDQSSYFSVRSCDCFGESGDDLLNSTSSSCVEIRPSYSLARRASISVEPEAIPRDPFPMRPVWLLGVTY